MQELWVSISNKPIPSLVSFYSKFPKKILPILILDSTKPLRTLILNKYRGAPLKCKLCYESINSFLSHRSKCLALTDEFYDRFKEIDTIRIQDWTSFTNRNEQKVPL